MNHLHSEGILHGDLKAGNVLLKAELRPVEVFEDAGAGEGPCLASACGSGAVHLTAAAGTSGLGARDIGGRQAWGRVYG